MDTRQRARDGSYFDTHTITLLNRIASNRRALHPQGEHGGVTVTGLAGDGRAPGWSGSGQWASHGGSAGGLPRPGRVRVSSGSGDAGGLEVRPVTPLALLGSVGANDGMAYGKRTTGGANHAFGSRGGIPRSSSHALLPPQRDAQPRSHNTRDRGGSRQRPASASATTRNSQSRGAAVREANSRYGRKTGSSGTRRASNTHLRRHGQSGSGSHGGAGSGAATGAPAPAGQVLGSAAAAAVAGGGSARGDLNWWSTVNQFKPRDQRAALTQARVPAAAAASSTSGRAARGGYAASPTSSARRVTLNAATDAVGVPILASPLQAPNVHRNGSVPPGWGEATEAGSGEGGIGVAGVTGTAAPANADVATSAALGATASSAAAPLPRPKSALAQSASSARTRARSGSGGTTSDGGAGADSDGSASAGGTAAPGAGVNGHTKPHPPTSRPQRRTTHHQPYHVTPADGVVFAEAPDMPGVPVVYRLAEARNQNPEQLNLDRRKIAVCPLLEGEGRLRLLNYQNNQIHHMCNFHNLPHLIFLDLYNNRITEIANLDCVPGLRVLMLGKNRITRIENLTPLLKLDVLDLHSNRITEITGLNHLKDLRVLNLAGNQIREVTDLGGLRALTELNLRRNRLEVVEGLDELPSLQRLFLSNNNVTSFDNIDCIFKTRSLVELAIDGNPVVSANLDSYRQTLVNRIRSLKHLDLRRVTDDERRNADAELRRSHEQQREQELLQRAAGARESAIRAVRDSWAHEFEQATGRTFAEVADGGGIDGAADGENDDAEEDDGGGSQSAAVSDAGDSDADGGAGTGAEDGDTTDGAISSRRRPDSRGSAGRPSTAPSHRRRRPPTITTQKPRVTGLSSLHLYPNASGSGGSSGASVRTHGGMNPVSRVFWELESCDDARTLRVYGAAFSAFDESKVHRLATCVSMLYVSFDLAVAKALRRLSALPKLRELQFRYNNLHSLHQVRALAARIPTSVTRLTVKNNAVTKSPLFKLYVAHAMPHLAELNGEVLTPQDRVKAHAMFQPLEDALSPPPLQEERRVGPANRRRPRSARDGTSKKRPRSFRRLARATASSRSGRTGASGRDSARDSSRDSNRDGASEADGAGSGTASAAMGAVAEFAKLVKAVKPPPGAVKHVARRVIDDAVRQAVAVETQLKAINQVWPDVVKRLVQETLDDLSAPDSPARLQAQLEALL